jgi:uncharacterized protein
MRFWDSSAIVPLILEEASSPSCRSLLRSDGGIAVWQFTRVEVLSAIWRKVRSGMIAPGAALQASRRMEALAAVWTEVDAISAVRNRAERLVAVHPLTAADALQLSAALVFARERPRRPLVTSDQRLASVAELEGCEVIVPDKA